MALIDPRIALSYQSPQVEDPIDVQARQANLRTVANQQQLQQQLIQSNDMVNRERAQDLAAQNVMNTSLSKNTSKDPLTGAPVIDYDNAYKDMTAAGYGKQAMAFRQNVDAMKTADENLKDLQRKIQLEQAGHMSTLAGAIADQPTPEARAYAYKQALPFAKSMGWDVSQFPAQYDESMLPGLKAMKQYTYDPKTAEDLRRQRDEAVTGRIRADAYDKAMSGLLDQRDAYAARALEQANQPKHIGVDTQNHPVTVGPDGKYVSHPEVTLQVPAVMNAQERTRHDQATEGQAAANAGEKTRHNQATEGQAATNAANKGNANKGGLTEAQANSRLGALEKEETELNGLRNRLGDATRNDLYFDGKKLRPFENEEGERADMHNRDNQAEQRLEQIVKEKNSILRKVNRNVAVSDDQAIASLRGTKAGRTTGYQTGAPQSSLPQGNGGPLTDPAIAKQYLAAAGGDKVKARQLAQQNNWKF